MNYQRVTEIKLSVARAVCAHHAQDGVVVPTNNPLNAFTTHDVDKLDNKAQSNFTQDEILGYALSATSHISHENRGLKRTPIRIYPVDT